MPRRSVCRCVFCSLAIGPALSGAGIFFLWFSLHDPRKEAIDVFKSEIRRDPTAPRPDAPPRPRASHSPASRRLQLLDQ